MPTTALNECGSCGRSEEVGLQGMMQREVWGQAKPLRPLQRSVGKKEGKLSQDKTKTLASKSELFRFGRPAREFQYLARLSADPSDTPQGEKCG